jgi:hypothetical protein
VTSCGKSLCESCMWLQSQYSLSHASAPSGTDFELVNISGYCIWQNNSSAFMRITSHVIGKPSLCFSHTYSKTHCSNSWKLPSTGSLNALRDEFTFLNFVFHLLPSVNVRPCNTKLLSCCTIVHGLSID